MVCNRRALLGIAGAGLSRAAAATKEDGAPGVEMSVPDKALEQSFRIALKLTADMRRLAARHYGKEGWLAVSDGRRGLQHGWDPRDFRYGPKCAAYLWGHEPEFMLHMGRRIFHDEINSGDGHINWDYRPSGHQTAIHVAQHAKHFADYLVYSEQECFIRENWDRLLKLLRWVDTEYARGTGGFIEHGNMVPDHFWSLLVGEPYNFPKVENCSRDVVVVASMEVCELLRTMAAYAGERQLRDAAWLKSRAAQLHEAIEERAYDSDAGYYYLLHRAPENAWRHSMLGLNEESRELDVTPYYAAMVSGNYSRAMVVAGYARTVLLERNIFPMPLHYPTYSWISPNYGSPQTFVQGGCWEESYYNCVRAWSRCRMQDAIYEAVRRRSEAYVRDQDCVEWYTQTGAPRGRDRYGISAAAHIQAVIEGLFGITPVRAGFDEIRIEPNLPLAWAGRVAGIRVNLPRGGFLKYEHACDPARKTVALTLETDRQRMAHLRLFVPGPVQSVRWNSGRVLFDSAHQVGRGTFVLLDRIFTKDRMEVSFADCAAWGIPQAAGCTPASLKSGVDQ